jgi:hypothetical protein
LSGVILYTFLKLLKIPVLRYTTDLKTYVYFWMGMASLYYLSMFGWFIYGVHVIYRLAS